MPGYDNPFVGTYRPSFEYFGIWEDWENEYTTAFVVGSSPWVSAVLNSGTITQTTDAKGGHVVLSGAATTDDSGAQATGDMEVFSFEAGKHLDCVCKFQANDVTQQELCFGVGITDATLLDGTGTLAAGITGSDGVWLYSPDGDTGMYLVMRRDSVQIATGALLTLADATDYELGFRVTMDSVTAGKGQIVPYNRTTGAYGSILTSLTMPYSAEEILAAQLAQLSGVNTGTKTMTVDYYGVRQLR